FLVYTRNFRACGAFSACAAHFPRLRVHFPGVRVHFPRVRSIFEVGWSSLQPLAASPQSSTIARMEQAPPGLTLTLEIRAEVGEPVDLGEVAGGRRRMVPITGGTFEGHGALAIRGRVRPGGADWQLIQADGLSEADARYVLEA